ncbi:HIT domain-containing protein [soil metagenome]
MDVLYSPWRYGYIKGERPEGDTACIFCELVQNPARDEENFILKRAEFNFVVLNIFPYAAGHLLIIPYDHVDLLDKANDPTTAEMMALTKRAQAALTQAYSPEGFNIGMNLGRSAGAGIATHLHMHILPRWSGDVNFMTSIGETRNIPEALMVTYEKLLGKF